jgi:NAD(P)-dependent dehydrogenase (short-subunit alcohol dehydrogenase family)
MTAHVSPDRLAGKVAVVTGAAAGIGRAVTDRLVAEGARVMAGDIDTTGLESLTADHPAEVATMRCDVTIEADVEALFARAAEQFGGSDIVVANAGKGTFGLLADHSLEAWREIIDLCLTGVFLTLKHASRSMRDNGSVITIASLNAIQPAEGMAAYCAAKAGATHLSRVAAMELGHRGIRVNTVAPGLVETNATAGLFMVPGVVDEFVENATLGRFAQPDEIASVVAFLASDEAGFMSSSFVSVDGGGNTGRYPDIPGGLRRLGEG